MSRPLLIFGYGVHAAGAEDFARDFINAHAIPCVFTWGARDLLHDNHPYNFGGFGTHGTRAANWAVQTATNIYTIGTRLDSKATSWPPDEFAPNAKVLMVDIDQAELDKFKGNPRFSLRCEDLRTFLDSIIMDEVEGEWLAALRRWKRDYPPGMSVGDGVNPYTFIDQLSDALAPDDVIVSDTGCALGWMMQAFRFKGQRFIHAFNNTPMGYGLPAAVGAAFATGKRVILVTGDGGLAENITEFATVARHNLNVKTILFNNRGHAMCRQTQRTWLGGTYPSTSYEGGLACPAYDDIADAYGIPAWKGTKHLALALEIVGPAFIELDIHPEYQIVPQVRANKPLHDADPALPNLEEIMRV